MKYVIGTAICNDSNYLKTSIKMFYSPISTITTSITNDVFLPNLGPDGNGVISMAGKY